MRQHYISLTFLAALMILIWIPARGQNTVYSVDFTGQAGNGLTGPLSGNQLYNSPDGEWSLLLSPADLVNTDDWARVENNVPSYSTGPLSEAFFFRDLNENAVLTSRDMFIPGVSSLTFSMDVVEYGQNEAIDFIRIEYSLDGGAPILIQTLNGEFSGSGSGSTIPANTNPTVININTTVTGISASRLQLIVTAFNGSGSEYHSIDNILITTPDPLPVEWVTFEAISFQNQINLAWATTNEINNSHFEVQRASSDKQFESIARVQPLDSRESIKEYTFTDFEPLNSTAIYRIKQVDIDGTASYSKEVEVLSGIVAQPELQIIPTVSYGIIKLKIEGALQGQVSVIDPQGRKLYSAHIEDASQTKEIDLSSLATGTYWMQFISGNGESANASFILR